MTLISEGVLQRLQREAGEGQDPAKPFCRDGRAEGGHLAGAGQVDQVRGGPDGGRRPLGQPARVVPLLPLTHQPQARSGEM